MGFSGEPVCRLCRREGQRLYLKGYRCYGKKCPFSKMEAPAPPGQHGRNRQPKLSDFGQQLRTKQKLKRIYGLRERQFHNYVKEAERRRGVTGENLLQILEMRLDNVVFRLGFASSRLQARQFVGHGHILVNGKRVDIPSYMIRVGDRIQVNPESAKIQPVKDSVQAAATSRLAPWLTLDSQNLAGEVLSAPTRQEIDTEVEEALIVEYYSR